MNFAHNQMVRKWCITGSVGFAGWSAGARGCYNFISGTFRGQVETHIGRGTGVSVSGGGTYAWCFYDM
jgi:hypothetical protein